MFLRQFQAEVWSPGKITGGSHIHHLVLAVMGVSLYIFQCQDVDGVTVLRFQYHWVGHLRIFGALPRYCFYPMYSSNELCAYVS